MPGLDRQPRILGVVASTPGHPERYVLESLTDAIRGGDVDAVVLQTCMSGAVATTTNHNVLAFVVDAVRRGVPLFLVVDAPGQQSYPRRIDAAEKAGGIALQTAHSAALDAVTSAIQAAFAQTTDPDEVKRIVRERFLQI